MRASLAFVQLFVRDWASAVAWYRDVLGLRVVLSVAEEKFALLAAGTGQVALKAGDGARGGMLLAFEVEDLAAWVARLEGLGVALTDAIKASDEGYRRVRLRDPEGHELLLFERTAEERG